MKKKVGWREKLNHGKDVLLLNLVHDERGGSERQEERSRWKTLLYSFVCCSEGEYNIVAHFLQIHFYLFNCYCFFYKTYFKATYKMSSLAYVFCAVSSIMHTLRASLLSLPSLVATGIRFSSLVTELQSLYTSRETGVSSHVYLFICSVSVLPLVALQIVRIS